MQNLIDKSGSGSVSIRSESRTINIPEGANATTTVTFTHTCFAVWCSLANMTNIPVTQSYRFSGSTYSVSLSGNRLTVTRSRSGSASSNPCVGLYIA